MAKCPKEIAWIIERNRFAEIAVLAQEIQKSSGLDVDEAINVANAMLSRARREMLDNIEETRTEYAINIHREVFQRRLGL